MGLLICVLVGPPIPFCRGQTSSLSFLTSIDILEKVIAHKGPYKPLSWIQNLRVGPTYKIPRLVHMIHNW
jgi:hypothetical protein